VSDFLEQVVTERRADVARARARGQRIDVAARRRDGVRLVAREDFRPDLASGSDDAFSLTLRSRRELGHLAVIAEVKRVSPALGVLRGDVDPVTQARAYEAAGASAISVLTEPRHWGGSIDDLVAVADAVQVPVLCKDIVVDTYQIDEAYAAGADAILLIAEALDDGTLRQLIAHARTIGLGVLVEAHELPAFGRAVSSGAKVVGVNARNLRRPEEIDVGRVRQVHTFVHSDHILVAESGIASVDDARLLPSRVDAVLIGTALMRAEDPAPLIHGIASIRRVHA
jgi:indole-3-glycerol phosphate synthase/indole-3-glycerol phosphate synthase/phosphoribosylanthranilate isomerase/anthranilate synthase/indole-3-glycerol phosphate synthase/phosphoribosylanthranilate isomerase